MSNNSSAIVGWFRGVIFLAPCIIGCATDTCPTGSTKRGDSCIPTETSTNESTAEPVPSRDAGTLSEQDAAVSAQPPACAVKVEACNGADDDCDGAIDEQLSMECGSSDVAPCKLGQKRCAAGAWGECQGAVEPKDEVCDARSEDENCDGMKNEGCECSIGDTRDCPARNGICQSGRQACVAGRWDTRCDGEISGSRELCDGQDNDCDGVTDNGALCDTGSSCQGVQGCISAAPTGALRAAIRTYGGYYITFTDGGGYAGGATTVHTDATMAGPWETFELEWIDDDFTQFALRTSTGNYVTAVDGGGVAGPNDATSPIHTDASSVGPDEQLTLTIMGSMVTIRSQEGYYLTAVDGGGLVGMNQALHTDGSTRDIWETFTLERQ
jgi:hypothetical protein